jgi:hypothetical protein
MRAELYTEVTARTVSIETMVPTLRDPTKVYERRFVESEFDPVRVFTEERNGLARAEQFLSAGEGLKSQFYGIPISSQVNGFLSSDLRRLKQVQGNVSPEDFIVQLYDTYQRYNWTTGKKPRVYSIVTGKDNTLMEFKSQKVQSTRRLAGKSQPLLYVVAEARGADDASALLKARNALYSDSTNKRTQLVSLKPGDVAKHFTPLTALFGRFVRLRNFGDSSYQNALGFIIEFVNRTDTLRIAVIPRLTPDCDGESLPFLKGRWTATDEVYQVNGDTGYKLVEGSFLRIVNEMEEIYELESSRGIQRLEKGLAIIELSPEQVSSEPNPTSQELFPFTHSSFTFKDEDQEHRQPVSFTDWHYTQRAEAMLSMRTGVRLQTDWPSERQELPGDAQATCGTYIACDVGTRTASIRLDSGTVLAGVPFHHLWRHWQSGQRVDYFRSPLDVTPVLSNWVIVDHPMPNTACYRIQSETAVDSHPTMVISSGSISESHA